MSYRNADGPPELPTEFRGQPSSVDIDLMSPVENSDGTVTISYKYIADRSDWHSQEMDKFYVPGKEFLWKSSQKKANGKCRIIDVDHVKKTAKIEMLD